MSSNTQSSGTDPWRPDFRDVDALPDVKIVRTEFVINLMPILIAIVLFVYYLVQMVAGSSIEKHIDNLTVNIQANDKNNSEIVNKNAFFIRDSKLLMEFRNFFEPSLNPLLYLSILAKDKYQDLVFNKIEILEKETEDSPIKGKDVQNLQRLLAISINGTIEGNYNESLDTMNAYIDQLSNLPEIKEYLENIELVSLTRDPRLGLFTYAIKMILNPTLDESTSYNKKS